MWHALKGYKRCIVPAQGLVRSLDHEFPTADGISYYEWQKKASSKVAHFTRLPLSSKRQTTDALPPLMFFAGLWDRVKFVSPVESRFQPSNDPEDKREPYPTGNPVPLSTFTILTTSPPKDFMWLHDRMPCMLTGWDEIRKWLDLGEVKGWVEGKGGTGEVLKGMSGLEWYVTSGPSSPEPDGGEVHIDSLSATPFPQKLARLATIPPRSFSPSPNGPTGSSHSSKSRPPRLRKDLNRSRHSRMTRSRQSQSAAPQ
jgi:hypothetical protein